MTREEWQEISQRLKASFKPEQVSWRVQGKANAQGKAQVLAYIDARDIMDRLDDVVGAENWSFDWQPIVTDAKGLLAAKGTLTICGVSKSDVGDASTFEGTKGTISDCLKRAAVHWGIGRYLYDLAASWVTVQDGHIPPAVLADLRKQLNGAKQPLTPEQVPAPELAKACAALADDLHLSPEERQTLRASYTHGGKTAWQSMLHALQAKKEEAHEASMVRLHAALKANPAD